MSAYQYPAAAPAYQAPATRDPTAVMGRRIGAVVVDFLLYVLIMSFVGPTPISPLAEYYEVPEGTSFSEACDGVNELEDDDVSCFLIGDRVYFTESADTIAQIVTWLAVVGLYSWVQGATGRTPGKALFGVKAVNEQGEPPGFGKSLARTALWVVDAAPWCLPLVGLITGLSTKGHRRVGDMAAKTFVVGAAHTGPVLVPGLTTAATSYYGGGYPGAPGQAGPGQWGPPPGSSGPSGWGAPPSGQPQGPWGAPTPSGEQPASGPSGWPAPGATPSSGPVPTPGPSNQPRGESPFDRPGSGRTGEGAAAPSDRSDQPGTEGRRPGWPGPTDAGRGDERAGAGSDQASTRSDASGASAEAGRTPEGESGGRDEPSATAGATSYNPQWDAARGTYIVWEPNRGAWLAWDDSAKEWKPI